MGPENICVFFFFSSVIINYYLQKFLKEVVVFFECLYKCEDMHGLSVDFSLKTKIENKTEINDMVHFYSN